MISSSAIQRLASIIENADKIVIITHEHPDGDAVGSSTALAYYLEHVGKHDINIIRDPLPATISFIDRHFTPVQEDSVYTAIEKADLILCTDFAVLERCGTPAVSVRNSKAKKILFDHHASPNKEEFDLIFSKIDTSSSCEVIFQVLNELCTEEEKKALFSGGCGYCLMCGMTTDTNNFSCATFPSTFKMASQLLSYGIDRDEIIANLYNNYRENRVRAFANFLSSDRFTIREDGLAVIKVSDSDWHTFGLKEGELEGLVNVPLSIGKVKVSIYLREDEQTVRVSIRAKRGWSARRIAQKYFNGGGHELASGGKLFIGKDIHSFSEIDKYVEKIEL